MRKNLIKEKNLETLRKIFREKKIVVKSQLSELSSLSVVTVNSLIQTLLKNNEIFEDKSIKPELGRPALSYKFNDNLKLALIIYMCEENKIDTVYYSVCNLCGEVIETIVEKNKIATKCFDKNIGELLKKYPNIKIIGFSFPGVEYDGELIVCDYPNLDKNFPAIIKEKYDIEIFFENDINSALLGYCKEKDLTNAVGIYSPSKYLLGSAIYISGKIIKGANNMAGEIVNLPFNIGWNDRINTLIKIIKMYMCTLNPQEIVIYSDIDENKLKSKLIESLKTNNERLMIPNIVSNANLNFDIKTGIITSALSRI